MKHKAQRDTDGVVQPHLVPVKFEFIDPTATTVCIAGTFNQWQPEAKALHPAGGGRWFKKTSLAPGTYEYRLVVDGQWMADPLAAESVPNPFGGRNSVLKVVDASEPVAFSNVADAAPNILDGKKPRVLLGIATHRTRFDLDLTEAGENSRASK